MCPSGWGETWESYLEPPPTRAQRAELPGYALAQQKCGICHSADYIFYQPPGMTQAQWTQEMSKMAHSYGAPLNEQEIKLVGAYLAATYGSAEATDANVMVLTQEARKASAPTNLDQTESIDVSALLKTNACLGCHAIDQQIIGPAFRDVASKYRDQADAPSRLAASIQRGGSGKWGPVAMPAMSGLSDEQTRALAEFVLQQ
jgi:cytochrome c551/c552